MKRMLPCTAEARRSALNAGLVNYDSLRVSPAAGSGNEVARPPRPSLAIARTRPWSLSDNPKCNVEIATTQRMGQRMAHPSYMHRESGSRCMPAVWQLSARNGINGAPVSETCSFAFLEHLQRDAAPRYSFKRHFKLRNIQVCQKTELCEFMCHI